VRARYAHTTEKNMLKRKQQPESSQLNPKRRLSELLRLMDGARARVNTWRLKADTLEKQWNDVRELISFHRANPLSAGWSKVALVVCEENEEHRVLLNMLREVYNELHSKNSKLQQHDVAMLNLVRRVDATRPGLAHWHEPSHSLKHNFLEIQLLGKDLRSLELPKLVGLVTKFFPAQHQARLQGLLEISFTQPVLFDTLSDSGSSSSSSSSSSSD
jgi:hypothetical protein